MILFIANGLVAGWTNDPLADGMTAPDDFDPARAHEYVVEGGAIRLDPSRAALHLPRHITPAAYFRRFTVFEEATIRTAAKDSMVLTVLLARVDASKFVDLDDPGVAEGLAALVESGLLTAERAEAIQGSDVIEAERL